MKTNWNALSEEAKLTFFDFYLYITSQNEDIKLSCPLDNYKNMNLKKIEACCMNFCYTLFPKLNEDSKDDLGCTGCPCETYGEKAFEELKKNLIKYKWFREEK